MTLNAYAVQHLDAGGGEQLACECLVGTWVVGNDSIEGTIGYIFPQQTVDSCGGEIRANFRDDGKVEVVYDDFEVSGRRDVSGFTSEFGDTELHTEYTSTTNARGVDSYEVKGDKWATNAKVRDEICSGAGRFCI